MDGKTNLTELLPYWGFQDGVSHVRGGLAEIGVEIFPSPSIFMDDAEQARLWRQIKGVLRNVLPQRERARFIVESAPLSADKTDAYLKRKERCPYPVLDELITAKAKFYNARRLEGYAFQHRFFLTMTVPTVRRKAGLSYSQDEIDRITRVAMELRSNVMTRLTRMNYQPVEMDDQEIFELCRRYFNPGVASAVQPRYVPESERTYFGKAALAKNLDVDMPTTRRQILSSSIESTRSQYILVGDMVGRIITMQRLPDDSSMNAVDNVIRSLGNTHYYLTVDYSHEPHGETLRRLGTRLRGFQGALQGAQFGNIDESVRVGAEEFAGLMQHLSRTGEHVYSTACSLIVFANSMSEMNQIKEMAASAVATLGNVQPLIGSVQNLPIYIEQMAPFSAATCDFRFKAVESTCGDFFPLTGPWTGDAPMSLFTNQLGGLTGIDYFHKGCNAWNGIIVGGTGAGKTFLAQSIIRDMLAENVKVIIIDRGFGYAPLMNAVGAPIIPMEPGSNVIINPFQFVEDDGLPTDGQKQDIKNILQAMIEPADSSEHRSIEDTLTVAAIDQVFIRAQQAYSGENDEEDRTVVEIVTMTDYMRTLQTMDTANGINLDDDSRAISRNLALKFSKWTGQTPQGRLVDGHTNVDLNHPSMYFETSGLDKNPEIGRVTLLLFMQLIFERAKRDPTSNKAVFIDEAWALLKHPQAKAMIVELFRRARRYGMAIYGISQTVEDFLEIQGLLNQAYYFFIGKNAGTPDVLRQIPGVGDAAIAQYQNIGKSKGQYSEFLAWIRKENTTEGDIIRVETAGFEYWMFTTDKDEMVLRMDTADRLFDGNEVEAARYLGSRKSAA